MENIKHKLPNIAKAVQKAYDELLPTKTSKDLETHNAQPHIKWDCINTCLKELDGYMTFETRKIRRGPWTFLMLFESNSQTIFTLIKKKRFESIQKSHSMAIPQYIQEMLDCLQNKKLIGDGAPYSLWENVPNDKDPINTMAIECISFKLMKELSKAKHTFIVFDDYNDRLNYLSAFVVDNNFYQVGDSINMMGMINHEMQLPLEAVPATTEKAVVALTPLALKLREAKKQGN